MSTSTVGGAAPVTSAGSTVPAEVQIAGMSPWLLLLREDLQDPADPPLAESVVGGIEYRVQLAQRSAWVIATWASGASVGFCVANALGNALRLVEPSAEPPPDGVGSAEASAAKEPGILLLRMRSSLGDHEVRIRLPRPDQPVLHWEARLSPMVELLMPPVPHDIVPLSAGANPLDVHGMLHATQLGIKGGVLHASLTRPAPGSLLYVQDFGALTGYFETTRSSPEGSVAGNWPELGFVLPGTTGPTLQPRTEYVLSSCHVVLDERVPTDHLETAEQFLELLAAVYMSMPRPTRQWHDWPRLVDETLRDLAHSPACRMEVDGQPYLRAYVGMEGTPPESMVQFALLVPLIEYCRSLGKEVPLVDELSATVPRFFDEALGTVVRHLPGLEDWLLDDDEQVPYQMDSWYLYHAIHNLCRLALFQDGDEDVRRVALDSVEFGIRVAHRFDYRWPVFYDLRTLEVLRAEAEPGEGGENDVGGQYAQVMLLAHELTGDERYVDEAIRAADAMGDYGFALGYQFNNTAFGALALLRLAQRTGEHRYRRLARVCIANIARNLWLWECDYGVARHYPTFMGLPPLRHAPYLAMYEELEVLAAFHEYLEVGGDELLEAERLLLGEYVAYLLDRGWYYYPSALPADILATSVHSGYLDRGLAIPLEDLNDGWTPPGSVGQEVYGAAAPFVMSTLQVLPIPQAGFSVHCDYPVTWAPEDRGDGGRIVLRLLGDRRGLARIRVAPEGEVRRPEVSARSGGGRDAAGRRGRGRALKPIEDSYGHLVFEVPGDTTVTIDWQPAQAGSEQGKG
jgi:hypothetical protein